MEEKLPIDVVVVPPTGAIMKYDPCSIAPCVAGFTLNPICGMMVPPALTISTPLTNTVLFGNTLAA